MKRKLAAACISMCMVSSLLAGCGSSEQTVQNQSEQTQNSEKTQEEVKIEETTQVSENSDNNSNDAIANLIAATDAPVDLTLWCAETEEYQTVMAQLVDEFKNTYPDVQFNITIGAESEANCKDDVLKDVESAADAASTVEAASVDGKLYAYPLTASNGYFLFYNSDYLTEEDVSSWDNLLAAAQKQGKTVGMEVSGAWYLYGFFAGAGLEMYGQDDGTNYCNWNATDTKYTGAAVAEAITDICKNSAMVNCVNEDAQAFALNGQMIADVNGTWATTGFMEAYGDGYAATKLPAFTVNGEQVQMGSFAGYKFVGVNAYSRNTGWAMLLAEYITSQNSQEAIGVATGEGPSNLNAAASDKIASAPALAALAQQSAYADLQRVGNAYWDPAATLGQALAEGNYTDVQSLLDEAVEGITQPVTN